MQQDILQTKEWANLRSSQGHTPVWIEDGLMLVKLVPKPFKAIGVMSQVDVEGLNWEQLIAEAKKHKLSHIQIDPVNLKEKYEIPKELVIKYTLKPTKSLVPRHTVLIDLTKSEEEILSGMKKNWRYNCKQSEKSGITSVEMSNIEGLEIFIKLYFTTVGDKQFLGRSPDYFRQVWSHLGAIEQPKAKIFVSSFSDTPLVARMVFIHNSTIYTAYTGTNRHLYPEVKTAYGAMLNLIRWGKQSNLSTLNLWGIDPHAQPGSSEYGYSQFKLGFNEQAVVELAPAYDLPIDQFSYMLFSILNPLRLLLSRIKTKLKV